MKKWITKETCQELKTPIMTIIKSKRQSVDNPEKGGEFYTILSPDWAVVIPVSIKDGKRFITLVRQYRHGVDDISVEFPCGMIEKGEEPREGARRELKEEASLISDRLVEIGSCSPNSAIMTNKVYFFVAEDCREEGEQELDKNEEIDYFFISETEVVNKYMGVDKEAKSAIMMAALAYYYRYLKCQI